MRTPSRPSAPAPAELPDIVAEVTARAASRGRAEREWLTDWRQMYAAASAHDDEEGQAMLLDVLYAFDAWLASRRPTRLRRIS
jgi:hypothetical protein